MARMSYKIAIKIFLPHKPYQTSSNKPIAIELFRKAKVWLNLAKIWRLKMEMKGLHQLSQIRIMKRRLADREAMLRLTIRIWWKTPTILSKFLEFFPLMILRRPRPTTPSTNSNQTSACWVPFQTLEMPSCKCQNLNLKVQPWSHPLKFPFRIDSTKYCWKHPTKIRRKIRMFTLIHTILILKIRRFQKCKHPSNHHTKRGIIWTMNSA